MKIVLAIFRENYNYNHCPKAYARRLTDIVMVRAQMKGEKLSAVNAQSKGETFREVIPLVSI